MSQKIFPPFEFMFQKLEWNSAPADKKDEVAAEIESRETFEFIEQNPDYYPSSHNAAIIDAWLGLYCLPHLRWNLEIAFKDLRADGLLELAPKPEPVAVDRWAGVVECVGDALAEYVPSDEEQAALDKLKDDPSLTDHQRKARDRKLKLLAGRSRREFATDRTYTRIP